MARTMTQGSATWQDQLDRELAILHEADRLRELVPRLPDGPWIEECGRRLLNLSGNDYLGLASISEQVSPQRIAAGAGASRLVTGNHPAMQQLEIAAAGLLGAEAAVAFGCGYLANVGLLQALAGRDDAVYSDRLNHASLVDGVTLSRARNFRYRHLAVEHLAELLAANVESGRYRRHLIVTESLFSMDGDVAPLREIAVLAKQYGALLIVDEAHAGGICGPSGAGVAAKCGLADEALIRVLTFGKAFGSYGACVVGSRRIADVLVNRARTLIYTTGMPPALAGLLAERCRVIENADEARANLWARVRAFRGWLADAGVSVSRDGGPIIPLVVGDDGAALALAASLKQEGFLATAIRPPTVPDGTARIRLTVSALHDLGDLERAAAVIGRLYREVVAA